MIDNKVIVFGQRGGKTIGALRKSYVRLMEDKEAVLYVTNQFLLT